MNHETRAWGLVYGLISVAICGSITVGGCLQAIRNQPKPEEPVPAVSVPLAVHAQEPAIGATDLWSDDRCRIDALLVSAALPAETQWAIFDLCGRDAELFCTVMSIAAVESDFTTDMIGDGGDSIGMMQINTRWHTGRMSDLGVTDLTDPIQCATVAIDYLTELEGAMQAGPGDHPTLMAYNCGPDSAKRQIRSGITSNTYSESVVGYYQDYLVEMGSMTLCE